MAKKNSRYSMYDEKAQAFAESCERRLKERYGNKVPEYIMCQLDQCVSYFDMISRAEESVRKDGLLVQGRFGLVKNPSINIKIDATVQLHKLMVSLLLTANSQDKQRKSDHGEQNMLLDELLHG